MDFEFIKMCLNMILSLSIVLILIFVLAKISGNKINSINNKRYMKIIDRLIITRENSLIIVKVGYKAYLLSCSSKRIDKIDEIPIEEVEKIEIKKQESIGEMQNIYGNLLNKIRESKGRRHED